MVARFSFLFFMYFFSYDVVGCGVCGNGGVGGFPYFFL